MSDHKSAVALITVLCIALFIGFGAGGYSYYKQIEAKRIAEERIAAEEAAKREAEQKELNALYDKYINEFKEDIRQKVAEYNTEKKLIAQITSPYNYETPEFAKENLKIYQDQLSPSLRGKIENIIAVFGEYQSKLENDTSKNNTELQAFLLKRWKKMSDEMLDLYVSYFSNEQDLLIAYEELMKFYYTRSTVYTVNFEENTFEFKREEDRAEQEKLSGMIEAIEQNGKNILSQSKKDAAEKSDKKQEQTSQAEAQSSAAK